MPLQTTHPLVTFAQQTDLGRCVEAYTCTQFLPFPHTHTLRDWDYSAKPLGNKAQAWERTGLSPSQNQQIEHTKSTTLLRPNLKLTAGSPKLVITHVH